MPPLLSVTVMTYNRAGTLRETLDSVLPQAAGRPEIEVLVSDNASTDETWEVMRQYCERYPGLRHSRNPTNVGFDGNVVACLENATGEYVAYMSDDDIAPPGLLAGLVAGLSECRPVAAYINHTPFFHNNTRETMAPTQPVTRRVFTDPTEFFLYTGLGFISALVLKRSEALKHISKVVPERGTAHVDIGGRTVLSSAGPFLFDGTLTVLARHDPSSGYDPLRMGAMNTTLVNLEMLNEGLLTQAAVDWHNRKTIRLFLQRLIVNNRLRKREQLVPARELRELYGKDPLFYLVAWPLLLIPPLLFRWLGYPLRGLMRIRRENRLKRAKIGRPPPHLAPGQG
jgi:glycosyltransferase involved in cell wall biosynthesis